MPTRALGCDRRGKGAWSYGQPDQRSEWAGARRWPADGVRLAGQDDVAFRFTSLGAARERGLWRTGLPGNSFRARAG